MTSSYSKTSVSVRPHEKPTFSKLSTVRTVFENLRFLVPENAVYTEGKKGQKNLLFFEIVWRRVEGVRTSTPRPKVRLQYIN